MHLLCAKRMMNVLDSFIASNAISKQPLEAVIINLILFIKRFNYRDCTFFSKRKCLLQLVIRAHMMSTCVCLT